MGDAKQMSDPSELEVPDMSSLQVTHSGHSTQPVVHLDPQCDPDNPVVVKFQEVSAAAFKIKGGIQNTQCTVSHGQTMHVTLQVKEFNENN